MLIVHQAARAAIPCLAQHEQQRPGPIIQAQATSQRPILSEGPALPSMTSGRQFGVPTIG